MGRSNVQMVVLSPGGRLLHVVTGYVAPKELHFELTQALASWNEVKKSALTAEIAVQRRALVVRQDGIQKGWDERFGPKGKAARWGSWMSKQAKHDREVVREHPLVHAGTITTRMLTGGPGGHFGYGNSNDDGTRTPTANEIRKRIGAPAVRETEAEKRMRKRRDAARAKQGSNRRAGSAQAGGAAGTQGGLRR